MFDVFSAKSIPLASVAPASAGSFVYRVRPPAEPSEEQRVVLHEFFAKGQGFPPGTVIKFAVAADTGQRRQVISKWQERKNPAACSPAVTEAMADQAAFLAAYGDQLTRHCMVDPKVFTCYAALHLPSLSAGDAKQIEQYRQQFVGLLLDAGYELEFNTSTDAAAVIDWQDGFAENIFSGDGRRLSAPDLVVSGRTVVTVGGLSFAMLQGQRVPAFVSPETAYGLTGAWRDAQILGNFLFTVAAKMTRRWGEFSLAALAWNSDRQQCENTLCNLVTNWKALKFITARATGSIASFKKALPCCPDTFRPTAELTREAFCNLIPLRRVFTGNDNPAFLGLGRQGQLCGVSLWDDGVKERGRPLNCRMYAGAGAGFGMFYKNFLLHHLAEGVKAHTIDCGGGLGAVFIHSVGGINVEMKTDTAFSLNPFTGADEGDLATIALLFTYVTLLQGMDASYAAHLENLFGLAVAQAWQVHGQTAGYDEVYRHLEPLATTLGADGAAYLKECASRFITGGKWGYLFNGAATSWDEYPLVVFDVEHADAMFLPTVVPALLLYSTGRAVGPKITFLWELWRLGCRGISLPPAALRERLWQEIYDRAARIDTSLCFQSMSPLDYQFLDGCKTTVTRSDMAMVLPCREGDLLEAHQAGYLPVSRRQLREMQSVRIWRPLYLEAYVVSPVGSGPLRFAPSPFCFELTTCDNERTMDLQPLTPEERREALCKAVQQRKKVGKGW